MDSSQEYTKEQGEFAREVRRLPGFLAGRTFEVKLDSVRVLLWQLTLPKCVRQAQELPLGWERIGAEKACSGCLIPLLSSLTSLREQGTKLEKPLPIYLGKKPEVPEHKASVLAGDCALDAATDKHNCVAGCPPYREELLDCLTRAVTRYGYWSTNPGLRHY